MRKFTSYAFSSLRDYVKLRGTNMLTGRLNNLTRKTISRSYNSNGLINKNSGIIRKEFLDYFAKDLDHTYVPSSPVLPMNDPALPFVNAGMNQFKGVFLGHHDPPAIRIANSQKCIRVGGKHNDLDVVGADTYHHTFFEMLGNWSFGDYFKAEACRYAWDLLTGPYGMNKEHLYVTYFAGDEKLGLAADLECKEIWMNLGVAENKLLPFGAQDNFWEMGMSGPCGPCTEIHVDHTMQSSNQAARVNKGYADLTELWNIVFIQYQRLPEGAIIPLSKQHVDTGMGFERLVAILQGKRSNYDTDLFSPLFRSIRTSTEAPEYQGRFGDADKNSIDAGYRILADHARMITVALADGMIPEQNYKLRRVLRKAITVGEQVFRRGGILQELTYRVAEILGDAYPEIPENLKQVQKIIQYEEELRKSLKNTVEGKWQKLVEIRPALEAISDWTIPGLIPAYKELQNVLGDLRKTGNLPGNFAFKLYDTYGLGPDTIAELAAIEFLSFDKNDFTKAFDDAKLISKLNSNPGLKDLISQNSLDLLESKSVPKTDDSHKYRYEYRENSYEFPPVNAKLLGFVVNGKLVSDTRPLAFDGDQTILEATVAKSGNIVGADSIVDAGTEIGIILDKTLFYSPEGGQNADKGFIKIGHLVFDVERVQKLRGYVIHVGHFVTWDTKNSEAELKAGDDCVVSIEATHRTALMRNHTSTHLLNAALRKIFPVVSQRASAVSRENLTFQFSVFGDKFETGEVTRIEKFVNDCIAEDVSVDTRIVDMPELLAEKDLTLIPGEVYPDTKVRIVETNGESLRSKEACCGTHVHKTGVLERFTILSVKNQGATTRTIKAVAGPLARLSKLAGQNAKERVSEIEEDFHNGTQSSLVVARIEDIKRQLNDRAERQIASYVDTQECHDRLNELLKILRDREIKNMKSSMETEMQNVVYASTMPFVVHCLQPINATLEQISLQRVTKFCSNTPVLVIAHSSGKVTARCCVPKEMTSSSFNAESWIQTILPIFRARSSAPTGHDPSLVCHMNVKRIQKKKLAALVENAIAEATKFAALHVDKSKNEK